MEAPLSEILRPKNIEEYVGQPHLMGEESSLRVAIKNNSLHSMILWGPPGVGKTTLALLISNWCDVNFFMLSAINSGVKDIRDIIDKAKTSEKKSVLFIDEIHRFSKSQQDSLLGAIERSEIILIGATTENPSFEIISPLLSRCQVYVLKDLEKNDLDKIIDRAVQYYKSVYNITINIEEYEALFSVSGGDARKLLNAIELVFNTYKTHTNIINITNDVVLKTVQKKIAIYDKNGENHYDIISAFIKSMRGSDPNAAVYWLARMLSAGEDPLFIARRMIILASEDIGNANPNALLLANNCFQAVHHIGMPEARIVLSQTAIYLACSVKSNASYMAIDEAMDWVRKTGDLPVPMHIRNAPTQLMKDLGYSKDYHYAHNYENNFVEQEFLPESISRKKFYEPGNNPRENELKKYLKNCWKDKYGYIILLILNFCTFTLSYSQEAHFSQFTANVLQLNPALTGAFDGSFRVYGSYRNQWITVSTPFNTYTLGMDMPVYKNGKNKNLIGTGINCTVDQAGDSKYRTITADLFMSYIQGLGRRNRLKLGIGVFAGIAQRHINFEQLTFAEQFNGLFFDPSLPNSEQLINDNYLYFDCGLGLTLTITPDKNRLFQLGFSTSHLNRPRVSIVNNDKRQNLKHLFFFLFNMKFNKEWEFTPSLMSAFQDKTFNIIAGGSCTYNFFIKNVNEKNGSLEVGVYYRVLDAVFFLTSFTWNNIKLGFSYDANASTLYAASTGHGAFEFNLTYIYKNKHFSKKNRERCPYDLF